MADVIDMTPALKKSYDYKKMKRDLYSERRSCREKMRLAQEQFLIKTKTTSMDAFTTVIPKPKKKVKIHCSDCKEILKGTIRYLKKNKKKPLCRDCFGKRLGKKKEDPEG